MAHCVSTVSRLALLAFAATLAACSRSSPAPAAAPRSAPPPSTAARAARPEPKPRPAACLPGQRAPSVDRLVAASVRHLDRGERESALACAEEAVRADGRSAAALRQRGAALAELDRVDEARAAYERALAVAPTDAETLLGAAGLLVERCAGDRQALETGLAHALRGAEVARPGDAGLAARLLLVAAMAENDLGRSREALRHAEAGLRARPGDTDLRYERGVALYELCRFREAEAELGRVLAEAPEDPWALHYLGLAAERRGEKRAAGLLARAAALAPAELSRPPPPSREAFAAEVRSAVEALPEEERRLLGDVPVDVEDLPAVADLTAASPPLSPSILGLFRGPPADEPCLPEDGPRCRSIVLYRLNLARMARDRAELSEQVRITLLHEVGHLRGEDDEELRDRGLE